MAGPAIRSFEFAHQLHRAGMEVTLATPLTTDIGTQPFEVVTYDDTELNGLRHVSSGKDVVVAMGWVFTRNPALREADARLVVDLYDPFHLENLAAAAVDGTPGRWADWDHVLSVLIEQLRLGDYFLCASERQRDLWLGALGVLNRVNPETYGRDPTLRSLIEVVPFGIPDAPPRKEATVMRSIVPGIGPDDFILFWGGGIYNWFDPLTLIKAVHQVAEARPEVRLFFLSTTHPNPNIPEMEMVTRARGLADDLKLTGRYVFFNDTWVPYERRADWLLESDVGISTHVEHAETRFSFRTRMLDYFWAGLPIICTEGDSLADVVQRESLGFTVPEQDVVALADAIETLAADPEDRRRRSERVRQVAVRMSWSRVAEPLVRFCAAPVQAADLAALSPGEAPPVPLRGLAVDPVPQSDSPSLSQGVRLARRGAEILASEGPMGLARAAGRHLRRD